MAPPDAPATLVTLTSCNVLGVVGSAPQAWNDGPMLRKQFARVAAVLRRMWAAAWVPSTSEHATDYQSLGETSGGLESEYRRIVYQHLERWGVTEACATVQVQQLQDHRGKEAFVAVVCLTSWERNSIVRVLLGLPLLDKKIRKAVDVSWLADVSVFRG